MSPRPGPPFAAAELVLGLAGPRSKLMPTGRARPPGSTLRGRTPIGWRLLLLRPGHELRRQLVLTEIFCGQSCRTRSASSRQRVPLPACLSFPSFTEPIAAERVQSATAFCT